MKYILIIMRYIILMTIIIWGVGGFIYYADAKSWWSIPILIASMILSLLWIRQTEIKRCPICKSKCRTTGIAGTTYKQWYCKKCEQTFWTTLLWENYE